MKIRLGVAIAALLLLAPSGAEAQRRQAALVSVEPLLGDATLLADAWSPVLIEVENQTRGDQHGELRLVVSSHDSTTMRRQLPLDVPRGERRRLIVNVFTGRSGSTVRASYDASDRQLGAHEVAVAYESAGRSVVVLGDPPRLRGALLDLDLDRAVGGGMPPRRVRFPVGAVIFDTATGDPLLPEAPAAWSTVALLVASAPVLTRIEGAERSAIEDWLRTGGRMLVFPRARADLRQEWLASLTGGAISTDAATVEPSDLVPAGGVRFGFACSADQRPESFGCSAPFGQGRVFVAAYDGTTAAAIETNAPRELVAAVLAAPETSPPALAFAREPSPTPPRWNDPGSFGSLRAALDPNEGFRPALGLVALVLLLYVIVVGPLNFRWVQKRNRPTLALVTTPATATACVLILLAVGYLGKGVTMRYRRVELVETMEGQARGASRRYTGLFSTRPGTFELPGGDDQNMILRLSGGTPLGPVHRTDDDVETLVDFRASLWETTFLREDRIVDLAGAISFERDGRRLAAVRNESTTALEGAIVIDTSGAVYPVGDVPAGGSASIPRRSVGALSPHQSFDPGRSADAEMIARHTGHPGDEDEADLILGLIHLAGTRFVPELAPVLYARLPASEATIGGVFTSEVDRRWLRVRPALRGSTVEPPAEPVLDAYDVSEGPFGGGVEDAGVDAGASTGGSVEAGDGGVP